MCAIRIVVGGFDYRVSKLMDLASLESFVWWSFVVDECDTLLEDFSWSGYHCHRICKRGREREARPKLGRSHAEREERMILSVVRQASD